jgi:hypothetical protein
MTLSVGEAAERAAELVSFIKDDQTVQIIATILFAVAVIHTFLVKKFRNKNNN